MANYTDALKRAAGACGIELEYYDIWGQPHSASDEVLRAILDSLGVPAASEEQIEQSLSDHALAGWSRPFAPAIVIRDDADFLRLQVPADRAGDSVKLEIRWEGGDIEHHWHWLPALTTIETAEVGGCQFLAKSLPLPHPLRFGYHDIQIYWVKEPAVETFGQARLIVCPKRAHSFEGRGGGVAISLYGLRSARNWGCGDFTDLCAAVDSFAAAGAAFIALNPLHAIPNRSPYNTSPYLPQCSLYRNFLYLDVERVGDAHLDPAEVREIDELCCSEFVEYERVSRLKLAVLRRIFRQFLDSASNAVQFEDFNRYVEIEGALLHDFATYCVLDETIHRSDPNIWLWTDWPVEYRDPRSPAVSEFAARHQHDVLFYKFLQWQVDVQLAEAQSHARDQGMSIGLYHDLALATDRFGADLWAHRDFYTPRCRVGAPPDDFSPNGQDWSFPPPNRDAHRAAGYELFAQSIRRNARHGGALRIDHVMRFFRLYWIPDGFTAANGTYVRDYIQDLIGILALESDRAKFVVIGEDLGTVTDELREALTDSGILSYRLLWFSKGDDGAFLPPDRYPRQAVVSTTTHDLPTLAGFTSGRDIEARLEAGLIDRAAYEEQFASRAQDVQRLAEALSAAGFPADPIGFLLSTPCALGVINQEDLTGEAYQQNLPGSTSEYPNWRRKMTVAVEDFGPLAETLRTALAASGRGRRAYFA